LVTSAARRKEAMSEAEAQAIVDKCHHTSFAKVDPADRHGACSTCIAAALQAQDVRIAELEARPIIVGHCDNCASGDALAERLRRVERIIVAGFGMSTDKGRVAAYREAKAYCAEFLEERNDKT
jgi:hypothetical protein